jgi:hypothetical protein
MVALRFAYYLLYKGKNPEGKPIDPAEEPVNVIMVASSTGPTQAVVWDWRTKAWKFKPGVAAAILYGDPEDHRVRTVDRMTAETEALRFTEIPLPSADELTENCRTATRT